MLLVVCPNYCTRNALAHAVQQFEFVNSRIIGVVMNRINENGGRYGYRYGKKYYKNSKYSYTSKTEE
jgi:Mrp family chromosome partitioning ATPase